MAKRQPNLVKNLKNFDTQVINNLAKKKKVGF